MSRLILSNFATRVAVKKTLQSTNKSNNNLRQEVQQEINTLQKLFINYKEFEKTFEEKQKLKEAKLSYKLHMKKF